MVRADAAANRRRVLTAAAEVFATNGLDASTEEVARRAGVGVGTVFRHFPTKRDLVEGVLLAQFAEVTEHARALQAEPDATASLLLLVAELVERISGKLAMANFLFSGQDWTGPGRQASAELHQVIQHALTRAQAAGGVRRDIDTEELYFLIRGLAQPGRGTSGELAAVRGQALQIVIDGLRPSVGAHT